MEIKISQIVRATAGRDSGELFFVIRVEDGYVYLANGKGRKLESPKRKKLKHICREAESDSRVAEKLRNGEKVTNSELRRALAQYSAGAEKQEEE